MVPSSNSPLRRLHPNVWVLAATSFLTDVSSEMLTNLLPLFLVNVLMVLEYCSLGHLNKVVGVYGFFVLFGTVVHGDT
mgnify:CR=1 FL=1